MRITFVIAALALTLTAHAAPTSGPLEPATEASPAIRAAIERYREIATRGGWRPVALGDTLHPGERSPGVPALLARLRATDDLTTRPDANVLPPPPVDLYDEYLVVGVRAFQARHGLAIDGVVGPRTLAALNVPVAGRIRQLELAVERARRRVPPDAALFVRVNIPAYRLELVEGGRTVLEMPVIVGRPNRATPELQSTITFLVLNPTWTIPTKLAYEDVLPKVRRDPAYLTKHNIHVYAGWQRDAEEIDPGWIDWGLIGRSVKSLKLRQAPGPLNPLGGIKFHMANAFDVYLHDTSSRDLFGRADRALSSGCVRVGDARSLATALLAGNPGWSEDRVDAALASRETTRVYLRRPVPVQLYYQTAWTTTDGRIHFRRDIYHLDDAFAAALEERRTPAPDTVGQATPTPVLGPVGDD